MGLKAVGYTLFKGLDVKNFLLFARMRTFIHYATSFFHTTLTGHSFIGLGDRLQQGATNYTLDLATGLTQVLADGTNTYLYGNGRIAQISTTIEYFLGDALGSVRQLADPAGEVTLTQSYAPYGETISSVGSDTSAYQFTGEMRDASGLTYLRARYLDNSVGRFISRDTWAGDYNRPLSLNRWMYVEGNPILYADPSGLQILDKSCTGWSSGFLTPTNLRYDKCVELWQAYDTKETQTIYDWYSWLWTENSSGIFEHASMLGMHFLGNTGDTLEMSDDFGEDIINLGKVKKYTRDHMNWYLSTYVKLVAEALDVPTSDVFGRDKFKEGIAINGVSPYFNPSIFLSWNEFKIDVEYWGTVSAKESLLLFGFGGKKKYVVNLNILYRAHDEYNWHPGLSIPNPYGGAIPDAWAYLLDEQCLAEHFQSYFEWTTTFKKTYTQGKWPTYNKEW